jgi:DNA repair protein RadA/Sms
MHCQSWNTLKEVKISKDKLEPSKVRKAEIKSLKKYTTKGKNRAKSGFDEVDRVLGGGIVPGEVILIAGEPGIGKTSLLLQILNNVSKESFKGIYISAEESVDQISLHAKRLGINKKLKIICDDDIDAIIKTLESEKIALLILDSIQTVKTTDLRGIAGGIGQVKECASRIADFSKRNNIASIVVSHITKGGDIAGPKILQHLVDAVLYLEGEKHSKIRLLRAFKNRYGSTNELGVLDFDSKGFSDAKNPSERFIQSSKNQLGICKGIIFEGQRPILVEVQALVSNSVFSMPQRIAVGVTRSKIQMLSAVLSKYTKINLNSKDIYVNIANGLRIDDTAFDLPIAIAILSSAMNIQISADLIAIGEISLTGGIHPGLHLEEKTRALKRLGYKDIFISKNNNLQKGSRLQFHQVFNVNEVSKMLKNRVK